MRYSVVKRLLLALCLLLTACAATPTWRDVPSWPDVQAVEHNRRVCAEQGKTFDLSLWRCAP